jgi:hypothetical protein
MGRPAVHGQLAVHMANFRRPAQPWADDGFGTANGCADLAVHGYAKWCTGNWPGRLRLHLCTGWLCRPGPRSQLTVQNPCTAICYAITGAHGDWSYGSAVHSPLALRGPVRARRISAGGKFEGKAHGVPGQPSCRRARWSPHTLLIFAAVVTILLLRARYGIRAAWRDRPSTPQATVLPVIARDSRSTPRLATMLPRQIAPGRHFDLQPARRGAPSWLELAQVPATIEGCQTPPCGTACGGDR